MAVSESVDVRHIGDASALGQAAMYCQAFWPLVGAVLGRTAVRGRRGGHGWGLRPDRAVRDLPPASQPGLAPRRSSRRSARAKVLALAWAYGVGYPLLAGLALWFTGLGGFDGEELATTYHLDGLPAAGGVALAVVLGVTVGCVPYLFLALGEEIGWRGVLTPHLAASGSPTRLVLLGGLIWSAFHLPIIVALGGAPDGVPIPVAALFFTVGLTALGATLAWQRLRYGLWPAVVTHAAVNATLYSVIEPATTERTSTGWFGSETGLLLALASVVAAVCWARRAPLRASGHGVVAELADEVQPGGGSTADGQPIDTSDMVVVHSMFRDQFELLPDLVRNVRPGDRQQAGAVADHLDLVLALLAEHHTSEDRVLWPLLSGRTPESAASCIRVAERQHGAVGQVADSVRQSADAWRRDPRAAERDGLAGLLEDLGVTVEEHLDTEEREILPIAASLLTEREWSRLGRDGSLKLSPRQTLLALGMIERSAGPEGLARLTEDLPVFVRGPVARLARAVARRTFRNLAGHDLANGG
ncbi:hemerythrin domain-containing protein [Parafrankia colletiae]|uniref:hemerythrin domain-containing protein n=1 Tax=Parafrankia colletiae TaxID=573497 RepID=UPI001F51A155|nr:hemerythrin domain-containing protein [Parafrankia colletiae]